MRQVYQRTLQKMLEKWETYSNTKYLILKKEKLRSLSLFLNLLMMLHSDSGALQWSSHYYKLKVLNLENHKFMNLQTLVLLNRLMIS